MRKTLAALLLVALVVVPSQPARALSVEEDLVSLVAMPLAVAAVSEIADVPVNELLDFVALLNDADVPPTQFIEVVRYVPVALVVVDDSQPRFIEVVREREQAGVRGTALVTFIEERINTYGLPTVVDLDVTAPRVTFVEEDFVPAIVRTRVATAKTHPHGGPPGQLKKERGLKTGAEVVHGSVDRREDRRRDREVTTRVVTRVDDDKGRGHGKDKNKGKEDRGNAKDNGNGKGKGKGKG